MLQAFLQCASELSEISNSSSLLHTLDAVTLRSERYPY